MMKSPYYIHLDFADKNLQSFTRDYILDNDFISKLFLSEETVCFSRMMPMRFRYDLIIFDDKCKTPEEIRKYCNAWIQNAPGAVFVHVGAEQLTEKKIPLICVEKNFYLENANRVIGFCFLNYVVKMSLEKIKKIEDLK